MLIKLIFIFIVGVGVLVAAIALNVLAQRLGLITWYDFVDNPNGASAISYLWLFFVYPLVLGIVAYLGIKITRL